jgi:hypothetical protein
MFNLDIFVFEFMQNKGKIVKITQNFNTTSAKLSCQEQTI